ncbi:hypothetical protein [uncultured Flavobacterium sp.]|uniref:hypothetical protein n=1 Tax=uncultured Flavobacterium sp. TaxID=165435 RepID=UPI002594B522|nr:hypothetical protein [uncultured Flavobacterium sp.]
MSTKVYTAIATVLMLALLAHAFAFFWFVIGGLVIGNNPLQWYWDLFGIAPVYSVFCFIAFILLAWFLAITEED